MRPDDPEEPEVFTISEIARAAGVTPSDVRWTLELDRTPTLQRTFVPFEAAVSMVHRLRTGSPAAGGERPLFAPLRPAGERTGVPLLASGALHAAFVAIVLVVTGLGVVSAPAESRTRESPRLVFIATPGPGGGGGGGGLRNPLPPSPAELKGRSPLRSPVTAARRVEPAPEKAPSPAPPPAPPVTAPVASIPADEEDRAGVVEDTRTVQASNGPGSEGGAGSGSGVGAGEGDGTGIGPGSIAGTGGGPYRPGSGITPPALDREVKPSYTEEARRRGVEGDVVMEVVVRADGSVGAMRVIHGLGAGLDGRAIEAVRQWRFSPARRYGTPVDVLVEIAVEFRLR
ncbi:MAG: energy transducer TonB [Acidobacteria bacterium]|nr:energy transducer TonB [Acidobacteriota bacterium]